MLQLNLQQPLQHLTDKLYTCFMIKVTDGKLIKQFRKRSGITQMELELRIGAAFGTISRVENGVTNPTKETLLAIAIALKLSALETALLFGINIEITNNT
jgi:transcriptional regulator with XRE-family HTH domain